jgi:hypothetical protein
MFDGKSQTANFKLYFEAKLNVSCSKLGQFVHLILKHESVYELFGLEN